MPRPVPIIARAGAPQGVRVGGKSAQTADTLTETGAPPAKFFHPTRQPSWPVPIPAGAESVRVPSVGSRLFIPPETTRSPGSHFAVRKVNDPKSFEMAAAWLSYNALGSICVAS